jgi:hypothetical protein
MLNLFSTYLHVDIFVCLTALQRHFQICLRFQQSLKLYTEFLMFVK